MEGAQASGPQAISRQAAASALGRPSAPPFAPAASLLRDAGSCKAVARPDPAHMPHGRAVASQRSAASRKCLFVVLDGAGNNKIIFFMDRLNIKLM